MADNYAGDVTPDEAFKVLKNNQEARLIDVRTAAEWNYVGIPDLTDISQDLGFAEWVHFPGGQLNPEFLDQASDLLPSLDAPVFFLCRSGVRSLHAAIAMTAEGYRQCFNIKGGFEGDKDATGHRGTVNGWKVSGLPWRQG